jgi:hypothetical protein
MNTSSNYKRHANADIPAYMRRMEKARYVSPPAGLITRFRRSVTETNWDRDLWGMEKWIDLLSWTVIASSLLYLMAVTLSVFGK